MKKILIILPVLIVLAVAYRFVQTIPGNIGTGESKPSPNGAFTAHAMDMNSESFWGKKRSWFEFTLENSSSGHILQELETDPINGPYFGSRDSYSVIRWDSNSTEVVFWFPSTEIKMKVEPDKDSG